LSFTSNEMKYLYVCTQCYLYKEVVLLIIICINYIYKTDRHDITEILLKVALTIIILTTPIQFSRGSHYGRDRMVVGFTTTCAISAC
jgi:hypothetical protein